MNARSCIMLQDSLRDHLRTAFQSSRLSEVLGCMQVCKHKFSFTPVYATNTPTTLPWYELLMGLLMRAARGFKLAHRVSFYHDLHALCTRLCTPLTPVRGRWTERSFWCTAISCPGYCSMAAAHHAHCILRRVHAHEDETPPIACCVAVLIVLALVQVWVVSSLWLVVVPWCTCLAWRLCFLASVGQLHDLLSQRASFLALVADCIQVGQRGRS
jgi:hypothetical protein